MTIHIDAPSLRSHHVTQDQLSLKDTHTYGDREDRGANFALKMPLLLGRPAVSKSVFNFGRLKGSGKYS